MNCAKCNCKLSKDDVGLHKKLLDRAAEENFLCRSCLAEHFKVDVSLIDKKLEEFKSQGCLLFK